MPVAGPSQTPEPASSSGGSGGNDPADIEDDEETVRRAQERIRQQSRPRGDAVVGSDAPDANPSSDLDRDAERSRQEADAQANRVARGDARDGSRPTGPTGPDETPEPASSGTGGGTDGDAPSSESGGGRDGSRPTGPAGPGDTPEPVPDDGSGGGGGGGRDGSRPTGPAGPDDTPEPVPRPDDTGSDREPRRRTRRRDGSRPTGFTGPGQTPAPDPYPSRQGAELGSGALAEQASALERRAIESTEGLSDASEVRVVQRGDRLVAQLTDEGRDALLEQQTRELTASIAPAAAAVAADPGRGRTDPNAEVAAMSDILDEANATTRRGGGGDSDTGEQFGDFRLGIPGTDLTFEGVARDAADTYSETADSLVPDQVLFPTGAGSIAVSTETNPVGRFSAGTFRGAVALLNVPAASRGLDEGIETTGYLVTEAVSGRGGEAAEDASQAAQLALSEAIADAQADPFGTAGQAAGSLVASAGIIGGASRVSSTAGRAAAYGIQPGEELASAGLSRAFPGVASRFPGGRIDNEEILLREAQRAGSRIRSAFRSNSQRVATDGGMNIPRGNERGQFDLGRLSRDESVEITSEDLDVERRGDPVPGERPRADEPAVSYEEVQRTRDRRTRERDLDREAREMQNIRDALDGGQLESLVERQQARVERAQESEVDVAEELVRQQEETTTLAEEIGVETESESTTSTEIGRLEFAQQPQAREGDLRSQMETLAQEIGVVSQGESDLDLESIGEFDLELEAEAETEAELDRELAREFGFETETESEQETELEAFVEFEREFESELFGQRRDRQREQETDLGAEEARRLLEFDVAGAEEVLGW